MPSLKFHMLMDFNILNSKKAFLWIWQLL